MTMIGIWGLVSRTPDGMAEGVTPPAPAISGSLHAAHCRDSGGHWVGGQTSRGCEVRLDAGSVPLILFDGTLDNASELRTRINGGAMKDDRLPHELVADLYRVSGPQMARQLKGSFVGAVIDNPRREVTLVSDVTGSRPLYWATDHDRLVFGSQVHFVVKQLRQAPQLDVHAVVDYLTYGFPFGNRTLATGVQLVPPGCTLTYSWADGTVRIEQYFDQASWFQPRTGERSAFIDELTAAFNQAVRRGLTGDHRFGLSLSGGLDSRAILSAINGDAAGLSTYTLGVNGCADQVIADQLSRIAGTQHQFIELDDSYVRDGFMANLARMVSLTDGMYLSHGLTEMLALRYLETGEMTALVRGHGGELAKTDLAWPFHTDDRIRQMNGRAEFVTYLLERVNCVSRTAALDQLFTADYLPQAEGKARQSLEETLEGVDLAPADLCSFVYLREHHRRFTVPSLELFRHAVDIRLPFMDEDVLRVLFSAPAAWRAGTGIHRAITGANNGRLLHVRNSNTGAPGDAGPWVEAILDKFNTVFKRFNVHGYRHYHDFAAWMQRMLLESVETILLDPKAVRRGLWQEATLRRLLDETRSGVADHAHLFQVLLNLELWQQENL